MPHEFGRISPSLSVPLISGYGIGILRISSDQEHKTESPTTKPQISKKNQNSVSTLVLNVAGPIPSLIDRRDKTFVYLPQKLKVKKS